MLMGDATDELVELCPKAERRRAKTTGRTGRSTPDPASGEDGPTACSSGGENGRTIARSFWGRRGATTSTSYRDYEYRLPRGRSYLRSGAVLDLKVEPGRVTAVVAGSRPKPYDVEIKIESLPAAHWSEIKAQCAGHIGSLIELLEGRLPERVMQVSIVPIGSRASSPSPRRSR